MYKKSYMIALLRVLLTYALFSLFGVLCAFSYLAFFRESPFAEESASETSPLLCRFLESDSKDIKFTDTELSKNIGGLIVAYSDKKMFAVAPEFKICGKSELAVCVPVLYTGFFKTRDFTLSFCIDENFNLTRAYLGAARLPLIFAKTWDDDILAHYQSSKKIKSVLDTLGSKIKLKIEKDFVVISKCD